MGEQLTLHSSSSSRVAELARLSLWRRHFPSTTPSIVFLLDNPPPQHHPSSTNIQYLQSISRNLRGSPQNGNHTFAQLNMSRFQSLLAQLPRLQSKLPKTLEVFTLFPNLPIELRIMIWDLAAMESRVLSLFETKDETGITRNQCHKACSATGKHSLLFLSRSSWISSLITLIVDQPDIPPLLHACRESREQGLRHYTKSHDAYGQDLYINLGADTLVFEDIQDIHRDKYYIDGDLLYSWEFNLAWDVIFNFSHITIICATPEHISNLVTNLEATLHEKHISSLMLVMDGSLASCPPWESPSTRNHVLKQGEESITRDLLCIELEDECVETVNSWCNDWEREHISVTFSWRASEIDLPPSSTNFSKKPDQEENDIVWQGI